MFSLDFAQDVVCVLFITAILSTYEACSENIEALSQDSVLLLKEIEDMRRQLLNNTKPNSAMVRDVVKILQGLPIDSCLEEGKPMTRKAVGEHASASQNLILKDLLNSPFDEDLQMFVLIKRNNRKRNSRPTLIKPMSLIILKKSQNLPSRRQVNKRGISNPVTKNVGNSEVGHEISRCKEVSPTASYELINDAMKSLKNIEKLERLGSERVEDNFKKPIALYLARRLTNMFKQAKKLNLDMRKYFVVD